MRNRILSIVLILVMICSGYCTDVSAAFSEGAVNQDTSGTEFEGLDDDRLCRYVKDAVYSELVKDLNDKEYFVNVQAQYRTKDHLLRLSSNSRANVYFGYTLEEIRESVGDKKFVFTVDENGKTVYRALKEDVDDTFRQVVEDVAIGTGVILVCVTASAVTAGVGAPAVSLIFATSAKTGAIMALSSGALGGVASGIITGLKTNDLNAAVKAGVLAGGDGFKWGAITGVIAGGLAESANYIKAMKALSGAELKLSMQEAAAIQMETGYPAEVISQFHSMEEYMVFRKAGLKAVIVDGRTALVRSDIDPKLLGDDGLTNLARMKNGNAPLDSTGKPYELHHIGQESDATLAVLTDVEHRNDVLHGIYDKSRIDRNAFETQKRRFWRQIAEMMENGYLAG